MIHRGNKNLTVILSCLWLWSLCPAVVSAQDRPVTVEGDVTIIETEIGLDQIVVEKPKFGRRQTEKEIPGSGAGAKEITAVQVDVGESLSPEKIIQLNRILKEAIEKNQELESQKKGLDQQLKNLRGQRTIEVNRLRVLDKERDSYKGMLENSQKNVLKLQERIAEIEKELVEKNQKLEFMLAEPSPGIIPEEGETVQVEISARELNHLQKTIVELRRQMMEREDEMKQLSEEQRTQAEEDLEKLSRQVSQLEEELKNKTREYQAQISELQTAKEAAESKAMSLTEELKGLEKQLAQRSQEFEKFKEEQESKSQEMVAQVETVQQTLADKSQEYSSLPSEMSAERKNALQEEIQQLENQLAKKEQEISDFKTRQKQLAKKRINDILAQVNVIEQKLTEKYKGIALAEARQLASMVSEAKEELLGNLSRSSDGVASNKLNVWEQQIVRLQSQAEQLKHDLTGGLLAQGGAVVSSEAAPEISFAGEEQVLADAAFHDRVRSQKVISMLDEMSSEHETMREDEGKVHYNMGNIFFHQGHYGRARDEYRKAVQLVPHDANAHFNLAFVSSEYLGDFKTALTHYQQYLWLNPEAEDLHLVKEKIIAAQMELMGSIDSSLDKEVREERENWWKYTGAKEEIVDQMSE